MTTTTRAERIEMAAFLTPLGLTALPIYDDEGVEMLRFIRNEQRAGFAHDNAPISTAAQRVWWAANRDRVIGRLYQDRAGFVVGYGLLRMTDDGRWWSSVAVLPQYGGRGYGGAITAHIIRQSPTGVVWAEARKDNPAACRLHHARDWEVIGEDETRWHYRTREGL